MVKGEKDSLVRGEDTLEKGDGKKSERWDSR